MFKDFEKRFINSGRFSVDDSLLYLGIAHMLASQATSIVDVGCGRGAYSDGYMQEQNNSNTFDLRGNGRIITGIDVDPAASTNPFMDRFRLIDESQTWPIDSGSADLVVSDWTLEHVEDPAGFVNELVRVLVPGGYFVARSINRGSLLSVASRLIANEKHASLLRRLQPARQSVDVFPAFYRMNSSATINRLLNSSFDFSMASRPGLENYVRSRYPTLAKSVAALERHLPEGAQTSFIICAKKRVSQKPPKLITHS